MERIYKPFDLEAAMSGASVFTRNGDPVEIEEYDHNGFNYPVKGLIIDSDTGKKVPFRWTKQGKSVADSKTRESDLVMMPTEYKGTGYVNIYLEKGALVIGSTIYDTRREAECTYAHYWNVMHHIPEKTKRIATIAVELEWHLAQPRTAAGE